MAFLTKPVYSMELQVLPLRMLNHKQIRKLFARFAFLLASGDPIYLADAEAAPEFKKLREEHYTFEGVSQNSPVQKYPNDYLRHHRTKSVSEAGSHVYTSEQMNLICKKNDNNSVSRVKGYKAFHGWDACTGFGTSNGKKLVRALQ